MRLNKYIAECGVASRRAADKLIAEGKVKVNNKTVTALGTDINEFNDTVTVDDRKITLVNRYVYIMLHKPKGCVTTVKDDKTPEEGSEVKARKTIMDYVNVTDKRIFPIGRLDYDTEGLILLTNDGALANKLTHPSNEIPKTYIAKIEGTLQESDLARLRNGIPLDGTVTHRSKVKVLGVENNISRIEITIYEGKNRQVRRMFEYVGANVIFLKRTKIGDLKLGGLGRGMSRYLTDREIAILQRL
ncbi:MAG: rRNA pseudouridine synthase [Clostridia bacterium]|nr:rRNA pseudouridine synthase [Clostridia bacterium]